MKKDWESLAREYCEKIGEDPDEYVPYDNGSMAFTKKPRWQNYVEYLKRMKIVIDLLK